MAADDCISIIRAAGQGLLSDDDITLILEELEKVRQRRKAGAALESR